LNFDFDQLDSILLDWKSTASDNPRRLVHGRGGLFPHLSALSLDAYGHMLIGILYTDIGEMARQRLFELLQKYSPKGMLQDRSCRPEVLHWKWGELEASEIIHEQGLKYQIQPGARQNIGFFPDMVSGRTWVRERAMHANVLNLFAYTCSFSVAACAGGALKVVNIDMSGTSLEQGRENHRLNQQDLNRVQFLKLDVLKSWGRIGRQGPYDLVICDPPTHQSQSFSVERDYGKVFRRVAEMLTPQGQILACLNSPHHQISDLLSWIPPETNLVCKGECAGHSDYLNIQVEQGLKMLVLGHNS
jgi:23S rRNA (cytosine1962-C5)-methyltransferase